MGTGTQPSLWEKLKDNVVPLLLLVGEHDEKFIEINREMAQVSPIAKLNIISDAAHNIHFEKTSEFAQNVKEFFHEAKFVKPN